MGSNTRETERNPGLLTPDVPFHSWFGLSRHVMLAGIAAGITGFLVGGIGGRVFMRIAGAISGSQGAGRTTEAGFTVGEITVFGSVFLVIFLAIVTAAFGAAAYVTLRPWLSWSGRFRGPVFGMLLFAMASATSDMMNPDNPDFTILGNEPVLVLLIAVLFVAFGWVTEFFVPRAAGWFPSEDETNTAAGVAFTILAVLGMVIALPLLISALVGGESVCGCEAPVWVARSFIVVAVSTVAVWVAAIVRTPAWVATVATVTGYLGTAGVFVFGLLRAISDAVAIIT